MVLKKAFQTKHVSTKKKHEQQRITKYSTYTNDKGETQTQVERKRSLRFIGTVKLNIKRICSIFFSKMNALC